MRRQVAVTRPFDLLHEEMPMMIDAHDGFHLRVPCLREADIDRAACGAGLYEMSPDRHAILGRAEGFATATSTTAPPATVSCTRPRSANSSPNTSSTATPTP